MAQKNEVAVIDPHNQLATLDTYDPNDSGLGEFTSDDLIIPRLNVIQAQSEGGAENAGKLAINLTGDYLSEIDMTIITLNKSRILFPDEFDRDNEPLCRSHNFQVPANDIPGATPMCDTCELLPLAPGEKKAQHKCEYANWSTNAKGVSKPPKCQEVWNLLVVDLGSYMPMWFSLKSTALKPLRKVVSAVKMLSDAKRLPSCAFQFNVKTETITDNKGTYVVPVFSRVIPVSPDEYPSMLLIKSQLAGARIQDSQEPLDISDLKSAASAEEEQF